MSLPYYVEYERSLASQNYSETRRAFEDRKYLDSANGHMRISRDRQEERQKQSAKKGPQSEQLTLSLFETGTR
jgi:hypothetical protein